MTAGCTSGFGLRKIASVPPEDIIPLSAGGPHGGRWQSLDLVLDFEYTKNSNALYLSGDFRFLKRIKNNFEILDRMFVRIHILDSQGNVLDTLGVISISTTESDQLFYFENEYELPAGASQMAFGYIGTVVNFGDWQSGVMHYDITKN
jgi:hypothetical protein